MKKIVSSIIGIAIVSIGILIFIYYSLYMGSVKDEQIFSIPAGSSVKSIARLLKQAELIPNAHMFEFFVRVTGGSKKIRAGEYLLTAGNTPVDIARHFISGTMYMVPITIPEGLPWWEVALRFEKEGLVRFEDFRKLVYDTSFLQEQGIPFSSAEGFLYPETYHFVKPQQPTMGTARNVIITMLSMFKEQTRGVFPNAMTESEKYKVLIIASIVEKEAQQKEERARIAGVYLNRIRINMILQADPTIIYGLGQQFEGRLRKHHLLDERNPYNTYKIAGLTPTPICSPSKDVIEAVLYPENHSYLYFVATKKEGRHFFSKTLEEHNRAVQKYQIDNKEK